MKINNISSKIAQAIVLISFIYAGSVSPILSLRFNDVAGEGADGALPPPGQCIGLKMEIGEGIYSGFDTDGSDFRIFVQRSFGTFGIGTNGDNPGEPQFTIGGYYNVLDNLNVSLDYVVNNLTDDDDNVGNPYSDQLRVSLNITF